MIQGEQQASETGTGGFLRASPMAASAYVNQTLPAFWDVNVITGGRQNSTGRSVVRFPEQVSGKMRLAQRETSAEDIEVRNSVQNMVGIINIYPYTPSGSPHPDQGNFLYNGQW